MSYAVNNVVDKPKTKEERIKDFVKALAAVDQAMQPFKEQRADLKKNYVENDWLSKEELRYVSKAYTLAKKSDFDIDKFVDAYNKVK
jgi:hypothetical protein